MKTFILKKITILTLLVSGLSFSQTNKSITVENVPDNIVWPIVYKTFKDLKLKYPLINKQTGIGETNYFNYSTMLAKNRAKYKIVYTNTSLTISIFNRQYLSKNSWVNNLLPMSKKQSQKFLTPIKKHVLKILADKEYTNQNTSITKKNTSGKNKGIFKDYAIAKINNKNVNILSFHENGSLLGVGLAKDNSTLKSLVFQENEQGEKTTMLFDEKGYPKSILTDKFIINIKALNNSEAEISIHKTNGALIKITTTSLDNFETFSSIIQANKTENGPSIFEINHTNDTETLSTTLGYAATAIKAVTCAASLTTVVGALVPCTALLLDFMQRLSDEDAFYYDELVLADKVFSLITFSFPITKIDKLATIIDEMGNAIEGSTNIYDKLFPEGELTITGSDTIRAGAFGDQQGNLSSYFVKSNYPGKIELRSIFSEDMDIEEVDIKQNEIFKGIEGNIIQFNVYGNVTGITEHYLEASQIVDGKKITMRKEIKIIKPNYYSFPKPDCQELFDKKIITKIELDNCLNNEKKCKKELWDNGDYYVSDNISKISDFNKSNYYLKLKKDDGTKYSKTEYGEYRSFVKTAPCMANWSGLEDKRQIIILVNEALLKIETKEAKIKDLQKVANASNYQKIAIDIKNIEKSIEPIKLACTDKVKKIAQKRTISYETKKTDSEKYYSINSAKVIGFRWGKYGGPMILLDIYFSSQKITKEVGKGRFFDIELRTLFCNFEDGTNKPVGYGLLVSEQMKVEGKLSTSINIKLFENGFDYINFKSSNNRATRKY